MEMNKYQEFMALVIDKGLYFVKPHPKNDDYFHIMLGEEIVCKLDFRYEDGLEKAIEGIHRYFLVTFTDTYDGVKKFVASHAEEVEQNEQANEEEETAGA